MRLLVLFLTFTLSAAGGCEKKSAFELTDEGLALVRAGKNSAALRRFEAAIRTDPEYAFGYYYAAGLYNGRGDWDRAEEYLLRTIELKPDYANAYYTLGFVLENRAKELLARHGEGVNPDELRDLTGKAFFRYAEEHLPAKPAVRETLEQLLQRSRDGYGEAERRELPIP